MKNKRSKKYKEFDLLLILILTLLFSFPFKGKSQSNVFNPYQSIYIGYDWYYGYKKLTDAFSFKSKSKNLLMENAFIPYIALAHKFNEKGNISLKAGYGFIKSSSFDTIINSNSYICERKLRNLKIDIEISYIIINANSFGIFLTGEVGINSITEKIECFDDNKYNQFGFGLGAGVYAKKGYFSGLLFKMNYYRIGDNILFGGGFGIRIYNNKNN